MKIVAIAEDSLAQKGLWKMHRESQTGEGGTSFGLQTRGVMGVQGRSAFEFQTKAGLTGTHLHLESQSL